MDVVERSEWMNYIMVLFFDGIKVVYSMIKSYLHTLCTHVINITEFYE